MFLSDQVNHAQQKFVQILQKFVANARHVCVACHRFWFLCPFGKTTARQKETLAIINRSGTHLFSMINDVLDISKIEAGRMELNRRIQVRSA